MNKLSSRTGKTQVTFSKVKGHEVSLESIERVSNQGHEAKGGSQRKSVQSREARVKLMSIRDVLHDRQARRMRDNALQKDGYKYMLDFVA